jgi:hypothetical protein
MAFQTKKAIMLMIPCMVFIISTFHIEDVQGLSCMECDQNQCPVRNIEHILGWKPRIRIKIKL